MTPSTTGTRTSCAYDDALRQCAREAVATLAAAVAVTIFFWGTLLLLMPSPVRFLGMPLWFLVAVPGGYLFSIIVVLVVVKRVFREIPLDLKPDDGSSAEAGDGRGRR